MKYFLTVFLILSITWAGFGIDLKPLIETIEYEDFDEFKRMLKSDISVNDRDEWGFQPLHYAVGWDWTDDLKYIKHLINIGAKTTTRVTNPKGEEYYEYEGMTPFILAARAGNIKTVRYFVDKLGADINEKTETLSAMDYACMEGSLDVVKYLHPMLKNKTVSENGRMPYLNWAINHEEWAVAKYLIEAGVNIKSKSDDFTALHHAVFGHSYNPEIMMMLVERGADVNDLNRWSDTPLHYAAWANPNAVQYLIQHKAKLNLINYDGNTPLIEAAKRGNVYGVQHLINAGADKSIKGEDKKTALQHAQANGFTKVSDIITGKVNVSFPNFTLKDEIESNMPLVANDNGDLELTTLDGKKARLSDYKGKLVFLNIWATWCPPCRYEMPEMQKVYDELKDKGFVILAVSIDEKAKDAKDYLKANELTFPGFHEPDVEKLSESGYGPNGYPTTFIIDPNGLTIHESSGSRAWADEQYMKFFRAFLPGTTDNRSDNNKKQNKTERKEFTGNPSSWEGTWYITSSNQEYEMELLQNGPFVSGFYYHKDGKIKGQLKVNKNQNIIKGTWTQDDKSGWFQFVMEKDGRSFKGTWGYGTDGKKEGSWNGER